MTVGLANLIEAYASLMVCVRKKDGSLRLSID